MDPDGDSIIASLDGAPDGAWVKEREFSWTPDYFQSGEYTFDVVVSDGALTVREPVTVLVTNANAPPVIQSIGEKRIDETEPLAFQVIAYDEDSSSSAVVVGPIPDGASFKNGTFSWTPTYTQSGDYQVVFTVQDDTIEVQEVVDIIVRDVNRPPVFAAVPDSTYNAGTLIAFQVKAKDKDGDSVKIAPVSIPRTAKFYENVNFNWPTTNADTGVHEVRFSATDKDTTVFLKVSLSVIGTNQPPCNSTHRTVFCR